MINTRQRQLILQVMQENKSHPTADEVFQSIRTQLPKISLATVYRNLNLLADDGVLRKIQMPDMPDRFDWFTSPHDHLLCECCGKMFDFTLPQQLKEQIEDISDMQVSSYHLLAKGLCHECRNKKAIS